MRSLQRFHKVILYVHNGICSIHPCAALEMVDKRAVIQIDGAADREFIITDEILGMDKAGGVLVNFYAIFINAL